MRFYRNTSQVTEVCQQSSETIWAPRRMNCWLSVRLIRRGTLIGQVSVCNNLYLNARPRVLAMEDSLCDGSQRKRDCSHERLKAWKNPFGNTGRLFWHV